MKNDTLDNKTRNSSKNKKNTKNTKTKKRNKNKTRKNIKKEIAFHQLASQANCQHRDHHRYDQKWIYAALIVPNMKQQPGRQGHSAEQTQAESPLRGLAEIARHEQCGAAEGRESPRT